MTKAQMIIIALEVFGVIMALAGFITLIFLLCSCKISGKISRKEDEAYIPKHLDLKDLDDEYKFENIFNYDDEFVKKENYNEQDKN